MLQQSVIRYQGKMTVPIEVLLAEKYVADMMLTTKMSNTELAKTTEQSKATERSTNTPPLTTTPPVTTAPPLTTTLAVSNWSTSGPEITIACCASLLMLLLVLIVVVVKLIKLNKKPATGVTMATSSALWGAPMRPPASSSLRPFPPAQREITPDSGEQVMIGIETHSDAIPRSETYILSL